MFSMPEWVRQFDARETWLEMIRWIVLRECAIYQNKLDELCSPEVREALLTLRIYREDIEFWEMYEAEFLANLNEKGSEMVQTFAMKNPTFKEIVCRKFYECTVISREHNVNLLQWFNSNKLLNDFFLGIKTGTTPSAGPCLCLSASGRWQSQ